MPRDKSSDRDQSFDKPFLGRFHFAALLGIFLSVAALLLSGVLVCKHSGACTSSFGCSIDGVDGCAELGGSRYSKIHIPFTDIGISIAWFGFFYYAFLFLLFLKIRKKTKENQKDALGLLTALTVFGFVFDIFLAYRNFFILAVPCRLCIYTYLCQVGIIFSAFWLYLSPDRFNASNKSKDFLVSLRTGMKASRFALGGSILLTLCLFFLLLIFAKTKQTSANTEQTETIALLSESEVSRILREFRALKKAKIKKAALVPYKKYPRAYIDIHEWVDFRCPHCREASLIMSSILKRWPGRINLYYRFFPLDGSCNPMMKRKSPGSPSCKGALAALCSRKKNYYADFIGGLFKFQTSQASIDYGSLRELTSRLGGNWSKKQRCMQSPTAKGLLKKDILAAKHVKVSAVPTITVNGYLLPPGLPNKAWLLRLVDALVLEKEGARARPSTAEVYKKRKVDHSQHSH